MKNMHIVVLFCIIFSAAYCAVPGGSSAAFLLFEDKLRVKGSVYQFGTYLTRLKEPDTEYANNDWGLMRTKGTLELLYNAYEQGDTDIKLFGFYQWWRETVPDWDGAVQRSMTSRSRHRYQGPYERNDDWINEMYIDAYSGPWNIRAGKQVVFWSEVEMVRTIDRINPLDLRYTTPGIDPWDEIKLGLWMLRGFYTSDLPGQLVFEGIWTPDFQRVRTPVEGTPWGPVPGPPVVLGPRPFKILPYGLSAATDDMFRRDQPKLSLKNTTFALRIRGTSEVAVGYLLDWTLSWYHGMNTTPVARRSTLGRVSSVDINTLNGYLSNLAFSRVFGDTPLPQPNRRFWEYKYFDAIGASGQAFIPPLKGVLRGEVSYEIGLPENKALTKADDPNTPSFAKGITGTTERDQVNVGLTFDRPIRWEWLQANDWLRSSGIIDTSIGFFAQRRQGDVTRIRRTFGYYDRSQYNFTLTMRGNLWNTELFPTVRFLYNTRKWGYGVASIRYQPGKHWRYETGYNWFFAKDTWDSPEANSRDKDFAYFRIGFEF